jgi:hypothetical protein
MLVWAWDIYRFWALDDAMEARMREICEEWRKEQDGKSS